MEKTSDSLPKEIIFEILSRLPLKSACRFRCVSPLWLSIVSDPQFVEAHYTRTLSSADPKVLIRISPSKDAGLRALKQESHFFLADHPRHRGQITASFCGKICHGSRGLDDVSQSSGGLIVCNGEHDDGFTVFNPSTREFVKNALWGRSRVYLGFDPLGRKHKILHSCVFNRGIQSSRFISTLGETEWRQIQDVPIHFKLEIFYPSICIDGVVYYIGRLKEGGSICLMVIDVKSESFYMVQLPLMIFSSCTEFSGRFAVLHYSCFLGPPQGEIVMWILEDVHEQVWSCKRFPVPPLPDLGDLGPGHDFSFAGSTRGGELVFAPHFFVRDSYTLLFCNLENHSCRRVEVRGLHEHLPASRMGYEVSVCDHVESLRPVRGG
ncbi:putative F-box protein At1g33020 [Punica granatum]|uniref:F-box domain-containing protein n=2 Tax=Punica granatum TaxID=22663 RepID=A0A218WE77_PUNGR|nr:putative F-box protein At1g33020 [Punica granatum]OWM71147.1 hypothetical protein CDL15_Pgr011274 [Punica granatum]PKI40672.1 hypothetical protein CRG98_038927 [Punica granatum]